MPAGKYTMAHKERRFAELLATGHSQTEAFRAITPRSEKWKNSSVWCEASKFAKRPNVQQRLAEVIEGAKLQSILSHQQWFKNTQLLMEEAREEGKNWNAVQALNRQLGTANGTLVERMQFEGPEESDDALIAKLSGGDPQVAATLRKLIGRDTFDA